MKKRQMVAMLSCLIVGLAGFAGAYTTEKAKNEKTQNQLEAKLDAIAETEQIFQTSSILEPEKETESETTQAEEETEKKAPNKENKVSTETEKVETIAKDNVLHFQPKEGLRWPVEGEVILDYSMDHTISVQPGTDYWK